MIRIEMRADNAAFQEGESEVARILRDLADWLEIHPDETEIYLRDSNGNLVGFYRVEEE